MVKKILIIGLVLFLMGFLFILSQKQNNIKLTSNLNSSQVDAASLIAPSPTVPFRETNLSEIKNPYNYDTATTSNSDWPDQSLTATQKLARDLFSKYLYLKQTGQTLTSNEEQNLVNNVVDNSSLTGNYKIYQKSDLKIINDNSTSILLNYGNNLGNIMIKNSPKDAENELILIAKYVQNNDQSSLEKIKNMAKDYRNIIDEYKILQIPSQAADLHLKFINALSSLAEDIDGMTKIENDPALAIGSSARDSKDTEVLYSILGQFNDFFQKNNINFEPKSGGYTFTHIHR